MRNIILGIILGFIISLSLSVIAEDTQPVESFLKLDNQTLRVIKVETETKDIKYDCSTLAKQKETIEAQKAREIAQRDKEIAEVDGLIAKCVELGITK